MNGPNPVTPSGSDLSRLSSEHEFRFRPQELATLDSMRSPDGLESLRHPLQVAPSHAMYPPPFGSVAPPPPPPPLTGATSGLADYAGQLPGTPLPLFQSRPEYPTPGATSAFLPGYIPPFPGALTSAGTPGSIIGSHLDGNHLMDHHSLNALAAVAAASNNGAGPLGEMGLPNGIGIGGIGQIGGIPGAPANAGGPRSGGQSPQSAGGQLNNSDNGMASEPPSPNVMYPWMSIVG